MITKRPKKKTKAVKTTGTRRTSDRVSRLAAKWMAKVRQSKADNGAVARDWWIEIPLAELGALCGSLLAQDEVKGQRKQ